MQHIVNIIDQTVQWMGKTVSWLSLLLVLIICIDVAMRYVFNFTKVWVIELEIYFFAILLLFGAGYAFQYDKHVRVDVFYSKLSNKKKAYINLFGGVFLLIPWCIVIILVGYNYAYFSFLMNESSSQPGGLPALYLLKSLIFIGFIFLLMQGVSSICKSILTIRS